MTLEMVTTKCLKCLNGVVYETGCLLFGVCSHVQIRCYMVNVTIQCIDLFCELLGDFWHGCARCFMLRRWNW